MIKDKEGGMSVSMYWGLVRGGDGAGNTALQHVLVGRQQHVLRKRYADSHTSTNQWLQYHRTQA